MNHWRRGQKTQAELRDDAKDLADDLAIRERKVEGSSYWASLSSSALNPEALDLGPPYSGEQMATGTPTKSNFKTCEACGAKMVFMKTANGANVPVDPEYKEIVLDKTGDVYVINDAGETFRGKLATDQDRNNGLLSDLYIRGRVSHFRTCTDPQRFSKKK